MSRPSKRNWRDRFSFGRSNRVKLRPHGLAQTMNASPYSSGAKLLRANLRRGAGTIDNLRLSRGSGTKPRIRQVVVVQGGVAYAHRTKVPIEESS